jgi:hypothetical protein
MNRFRVFKSHHQKYRANNSPHHQYITALSLSSCSSKHNLSIICFPQSAHGCVFFWSEVRCALGRHQKDSSGSCSPTRIPRRYIALKPISCGNRQSKAVRMTRLIVYSTAFVAFLGGKLDVSNSSRNSSLTPPATAMTLAAIFIPDWITWAVDTDNGGHFTRTIGLHRACSSTTGKCVHYPQQEDCSGSDRYFCSMWRSVGFMMSFAAMLELATLVAYVVVILGGKQKREGGWKVLASMLLLVGVVQCASMAIVVGYAFSRAQFCC